MFHKQITIRLLLLFSGAKLGVSCYTIMSKGLNKSYMTVYAVGFRMVIGGFY